VPTASNGSVELYYAAAGSGHTVCFVADLGCGPWLWSWQAPALVGRYETLVWDLRGTGRSDVPEDYAIDRMTGDLEAVLAAHGARNATVVGAGMGGMIALQYAREYSRADGLVLLGTTAAGDRFDGEAFCGGPEDLSALTSAAFREAHPEAIDRIAAWRRDEDAPEAAKRAQAEAVAVFEAGENLYEITEPALVCHGDADAVVRASAGETLAADLPRGSFEEFPEGSHFVFVEQSRLVTDAIDGFLESRMD